MNPLKRVHKVHRICNNMIMSWLQGRFYIARNVSGLLSVVVLLPRADDEYSCIVLGCFEALKLRLLNIT